MKSLNCLVIGVLLLLSSCVSVQYRDPVEMSQEEISTMKVNYSIGRSKVPVAGKIYECPSNSRNASKNFCTIVVCKEDSTKSTGLNCLSYVPLKKSEMDIEQDQSQKDIAHSKYALEFQLAKESYLENNSKDMESFCNKLDVTCYLNKRFYPMNKQIAANSTKVESRESFELKVKSRTDVIEVLIYK